MKVSSDMTDRLQIYEDRSINKFSKWRHFINLKIAKIRNIHWLGNLI